MYESILPQSGLRPYVCMNALSENEYLLIHVRQMQCAPRVSSGEKESERSRGLSDEVDDGGFGSEDSAFPVRKRSARLGGKHVRTQFWCAKFYSDFSVCWSNGRSDIDKFSVPLDIFM